MICPFGTGLSKPVNRKAQKCLCRGARDINGRALTVCFHARARRNQINLIRHEAGLPENARMEHILKRLMNVGPGAPM